MDFSGIWPLVVKFGGWIALIVLILIGVAIIGVAAFFYNKNKSYSKHKVIVYERIKGSKGEEMPIILDRTERGRIWYNKKLKRYGFELKNANIVMGEEELKSFDEDRDLDVPHIQYGSGGTVVFIERLGVRKYAFGKAFIFDGAIKVIVSNADCAEAMKSYDMNAKTFGKKDNAFWGAIGLITICVLILILMIVFLNKLDGMKDVAAGFNDGAHALLQAKQAGAISTAPV